MVRHKIENTGTFPGTDNGEETKTPKQNYGRESQRLQRELAIKLGEKGLNVSAVYAILDALTDNVRNSKRRVAVLGAMLTGMSA